ncbi:MAG: CHASE2 domain-containing protein, partial [Deltaproteobacteria bacterium]|nr:CHASE2 domain-containing protein [Deltaproteobacteria bacterium]
MGSSRVRRARNVPLWTAIAATIVATTLAVVHARVVPLPGMASLEGLSIDARFRMRGARAPGTDRIVIVALDDDTRVEAPEVFQTRRGYARLFDALTAYDPKVVAVDLLFGSREEILPAELAERVRAANATPPADPALAALIAAIAEELRGDEVLAEALGRSKRVVLGAYFVQGAAVANAKEPAGFAVAGL